MSEARRFLLYAAVGTGATAIHYGVLIAGVEWVHLPPPTAAASGALSGALVSYACNRRFTFASTAPHRQALPRFVLTTFAGALLTMAVVAAGVDARWPYLLAQMLATALVLVLGFVLNRCWTFE